MITENEMQRDKLYYSDFYDKSYAVIKPLKVTKRKGRIFWFNAEVIDNTHIDNKTFNTVGSIHSYSNSFIFTSLEALKADVEPSKARQISWLIKEVAIFKKAV